MIPSGEVVANRSDLNEAMKKGHGVESEKIIRQKVNGELEYQPDDLTIEEPLEIRIGRKTVAVTMRTPGQDEDLALGFLLSEGLIRSSDQVARMWRPEHARNAHNIMCI